MPLRSSPIGLSSRPPSVSPAEVPSAGRDAWCRTGLRPGAACRQRRPFTGRCGRRRPRTPYPMRPTPAGCRPGRPVPLRAPERHGTLAGASSCRPARWSRPCLLHPASAARSTTRWASALAAGGPATRSRPGGASTRPGAPTSGASRQHTWTALASASRCCHSRGRRSPAPATTFRVDWRATMASSQTHLRQLGLARKRESGRFPGVGGGPG